MLVIELSFPGGRYHATPWGRHVNEGVPEWPPSPYRLIRALYDGWKRKRSDWRESRVQPILKALASSCPMFRLPQATVSHTRSYLSQNTGRDTDRTLIFDGFVVLERSAVVLIGWPEIELEPDMRQDLSELFGVLNYLGRSESWVSVRLLDGVAAVDWNSVPATDGDAPELEIVPVACAVSAVDYEKAPATISLGTKKKTTRVLGWIDAIAFSTADLFDTRRSDPPGLQIIRYTRRRDCLSVQPRRQPRRVEQPVCAVLYALESRVLPMVTETLEVAERARRKLMGIHGRLAGEANVSWKFSGKQSDGTRPDGHRHAFILPSDDDSDGRLDHLLVSCREPFDRLERLALDAMESLWQRGGRPDIRCIPVRWGAASELRRSGKRLVSATPFVPARHWRRGRGSFDEWLAEELVRECANHGLPRPKNVLPVGQLRLPDGRELRWLEFRRNRKDDTPAAGFGFEIEFADPIPGPVALGYGCHFGLGQFRAVGPS